MAPHPGEPMTLRPNSWLPAIVEPSAAVLGELPGTLMAGEPCFPRRRKDGTLPGHLLLHRCHVPSPARKRASWEGPALACLVALCLFTSSKFVLKKMQEEASCPFSAQSSHHVSKSKRGYPAHGHCQRCPMGLQLHLAHFMGVHKDDGRQRP